MQECEADGWDGLQGRPGRELWGQRGPAAWPLPEPLPTRCLASEAGLVQTRCLVPAGRPPAGFPTPTARGPPRAGRRGPAHTCRHTWAPRAGRVLISPLSGEFLQKTKQTKKVLVLPGSLPVAKWVSPGASGAAGSAGPPTPSRALVPPCRASAWGPVRLQSLVQSGLAQQRPQPLGRKCGELPVGRGDREKPHASRSVGSPPRSEHQTHRQESVPPPRGVGRGFPLGSRTRRGSSVPPG